MESWRLCDLFLQSIIGLDWLCCGRILTNQLYIFESIFIINNEQKYQVCILLLFHLENDSELFPQEVDYELTSLTVGLFYRKEKSKDLKKATQPLHKLCVCVCV